VDGPPALLLLARHGETDWNRDRRLQGWQGVPLNDVGRAQARRLAERLRETPVDVLLASDLPRAAETARILGSTLGLEPRLDAAWRELGFGALEGMDARALAAEHGELLAATARAGRSLGEGGESWAEVSARLEAGYEAICREHSGRTVLLVGHGGTLKALIASLIGLDPVHLDRLSLRGNTGLSVVDFRHGRPQLTLLNCTAHLERGDGA